MKKVQTTTTKSGKEVILKNDRNFFARLLVQSQHKQLDLQDVLAYSLGTVSYPLANNDGTLAKTNKAALLALLESKTENCCLESIPESGAVMVDGMALLQSLSTIPATFGELADVILQQLISLAKKLKCNRVDFVTDRYPTVSIKNAERARRAIGGSQVIQIYSPSQKTPSQWKKFLSSGVNKEALVNFLFTVWTEASFQSLSTDVAIYISHSDKCHLIQVTHGVASISVVQELHCDHEEADTRLLLHAKHSSLDHDTILIRSPDTDVAVIALSLLNQFSPDVKLYFLTGTKNKTRMVDLKLISTSLGPKICSALIGIHCFTGCDSTSAFFGKGKKKAFTIAAASDEFLDTFREIGSNFDLSSTTTRSLERFVCKLYGQNLTDINEARYKLFCLSSSSEKNLPPTKDALFLHSKRSNYQAAIHRRSLTNIIGAPSPEGNGWVLSNEELAIVWMTKPPAPDIVLETVHCSCKVGNCTSGRCSCSVAKLSCTDMCKCCNCQNINLTEEKQSQETRVFDTDSSDSDDDL